MERFLDMYTGEQPPTEERARAAADTTAEGKIALGFAHAQGLLGLSEDQEEAVKWYRAAADEDCGKAYMMLGSCYKHGIGVEASLEESNRMYEEAAARGDPDSIFNLGLSASQANDMETAVKWYRKGSEVGSIACKINLAMMYEKGDHVQQSWEDALKLYREAAISNDKRFIGTACRNVSNCYTNGWGVEIDLAEANKWITRAAEAGDAEAQAILGSRSEHGEGIEKNMEEAFRWYNEAAKQGHTGSLFNVANCLFNGWGTEADPEQGFAIFQMLAYHGFPHAVSEVQRIKALARMKKELEENGISVDGINLPDGVDFGIDDDSNEQSEEEEEEEEDTGYTRAAIQDPNDPQPNVVGQVDPEIKCPTCDNDLIHNEFTRGEHNAGGYEEGWWCDLCAAPSDKDGTSLRVHCPHCNVDLCTQCMAAHAQSTLALRRVFAERNNLSAHLLLAKDYIAAGDRPTGCGVASALIGVAWLLDLFHLELHGFEDLHAEALYLLGHQLETGEFLPCKPTVAKNLIVGAAKLGCVPAVLWAENNKDEEKEQSDPDALLAASIESDDAKGIHDAAELLSAKGRQEEHVEAHLKAAALGYGESMNMLGYAYHHGVGVPESGEKAFEWYSKGAEAGSTAAQVNVGVCYVDGVGVKRDMAKAVPLYQAAAGRGDPLGMNNLAYVMKRGGDWGPPDESTAYRWYRKAAEHPVGSTGLQAQAMSNVVQMIELGVGTEVDRPESFRWALLALFFGKTMYLDMVKQTRANVDEAEGIGCCHAMRLFVNGKEV